jgi:hypothetical protein
MGRRDVLLAGALLAGLLACSSKDNTVNSGAANISGLPGFTVRSSILDTTPPVPVINFFTDAPEAVPGTSGSSQCSCACTSSLHGVATLYFSVNPAQASNRTFPFSCLSGDAGTPIGDGGCTQSADNSAAILLTVGSPQDPHNPWTSESGSLTFGVSDSSQVQGTFKAVVVDATGANPTPIAGTFVAPSCSR